MKHKRKTRRKKTYKRKTNRRTYKRKINRKTYKRKTNRRIKNKQRGGSRFEGEGQFQSSLPDRSIEVSGLESPRVVSQNLLDIIYNDMGLPSVIYDLFCILYLLKNKSEHEIFQMGEDIQKILEFIPTNSGQMPALIDSLGVVEMESVSSETTKAASEMTYMELKRKAIALGMMKHEIPADKDELMEMVMAKTVAADPETKPASGSGASVTVWQLNTPSSKPRWNVYVSPSADSRIIGTLNDGAMVRMVKENRGWLRLGSGAGSGSSLELRRPGYNKWVMKGKDGDGWSQVVREHTVPRLEPSSVPAPRPTPFGVYDLNHNCRLINDRCADTVQEIKEFIMEYLMDIPFFESLMKGEKPNEMIRSPEPAGVDEEGNEIPPPEVEPIDEEAIKAEYEAKIKTEFKQLLDSLGEKIYALPISSDVKNMFKDLIDIVRSLGIIDLELEYNCGDNRKVILYRSGEKRWETWEKYSTVRGTLSFGSSILAGILNGLGASVGGYLYTESEYSSNDPVLTAFIFNPHEYDSLFYIPPLIPVASILAGRGYLFHSRSKIPKEMTSDLSSIMGFGPPETSGKVADKYLTSDEDRGLNALLTHLTKEQIEEQFVRMMSKGPEIRSVSVDNRDVDFRIYKFEGGVHVIEDEKIKEMREKQIEEYSHLETDEAKKKYLSQLFQSTHIDKIDKSLYYEKLFILIKNNKEIIYNFIYDFLLNDEASDDMSMEDIIQELNIDGDVNQKRGVFQILFESKHEETKFRKLIESMIEGTELTYENIMSMIKIISQYGS